MVRSAKLQTIISSLILVILLTGFSVDVRSESNSISSTIYVSEWSRLRHLSELGDPKALFQLGNLYYRPPPKSGIAINHKKAFQLFSEAANKGHIASQHNVGVLYLQGDGIEADPVKALAWFMIAAENGNKSAAKVVTRLKSSNSDIAALEKTKDQLLKLIQSQKTAQ